MTLRQAHKNKKKLESQQGATLLLSILVLSAITAIVFSVSVIVINEIKTSGNLAKTEPVITADEAVAEDQLFKIMRGLGTVPTCGSPSTMTLNSVSVKTCASYYLPNPYSFSLSQSSRRDFFMYNPNGGGNPGYTSASVQLVSGVSSTLYFCTFDVPDCVSNPNIDSKTLTSGGQTSWTSPALDPATAYQLVIINGASSIANYSVSANPNGFPAGVTNIQNSGSSQGVTRSIQVSVPQ